MVKINEFTYNSTEMRAISYWQYGKNWPVVYIIHNDNEAYVGETLDAVRRTSQHLQEKDLDSLQKIVFITDNRYIGLNYIFTVSYLFIIIFKYYIKWRRINFTRTIIAFNVIS